MSNPYGPYEPNQQPGVPPYQQQPAYQPYPVAPAPAPSGGTGITAGVLAVLGGLTNIGIGLFLIVMFAVLGDNEDFQRGFSDAGGTDDMVALMIIAGVLLLICGVVLLVGSIMLFQRSMAGRALVVGGCGLSILGSIVGFAMDAGTAASTPTSSCGVIFPVITLVLALLPSTTQWIRAKNAPAPQPGYPPHYY